MKVNDMLEEVITEKILDYALHAIDLVVPFLLGMLYQRLQKHKILSVAIEHDSEQQCGLFVRFSVKNEDKSPENVMLRINEQEFRLIYSNSIRAKEQQDIIIYQYSFDDIGRTRFYCDWQEKQKNQITLEVSWYDKKRIKKFSSKETQQAISEIKKYVSATGEGLMDFIKKNFRS